MTRWDRLTEKKELSQTEMLRFLPRPACFGQGPEGAIPLDRQVETLNSGRGGFNAWSSQGCASCPTEQRVELNHTVFSFSSTVWNQRGTN